MFAVFNDKSGVRSATSIFSTGAMVFAGAFVIGVSRAAMIISADEMKYPILRGDLRRMSATENKDCFYKHSNEIMQENSCRVLV